MYTDVKGYSWYRDIADKKKKKKKKKKNRFWLDRSRWEFLYLWKVYTKMYFF